MPILIPEIAMAAIAPAILGVSPRRIMDTTVNRRLMSVVSLRPRRSTSGPTKGTVEPTAMNWATRSQMAISPELRS